MRPMMPIFIKYLSTGTCPFCVLLWATPSMHPQQQLIICLRCVGLYGLLIVYICVEYIAYVLCVNVWVFFIGVLNTFYIYVYAR